MACYRNLNELSNPTEKLSVYKGSSRRYAKFNNLINPNGLIDIGQVGIPFTWYKKREAIETIFTRLDRVLINVHRLRLYPTVVSNNLPIFRLDHPPILLNLTEICAQKGIIILN